MITPMEPSSNTVVRVGVLFSAPVQFLDVAPVDILGMLTPDYLKASGMPSNINEQGIPFEFHYIAEDEPGSSIQVTAGARIVITVRLHLLSSTFNGLIFGRTPSPV